jgi:hypothetical protein
MYPELSLYRNFHLPSPTLHDTFIHIFNYSIQT